MLRKILVVIPVFSAVILVFLFSSCKNETTAPEQPVLIGLSGKIIDTSGVEISGVQIYCTFYESGFPDEFPVPAKLNKISGQNSFTFTLYQNTPNPIINATFFRFSIPSDGDVSLKVSDKLNSQIVYTYTDKLVSGLYQVGMRNFVDSLKLKNGIYNYTLDFKSKTGESFKDSKELFILSSHGSPNCESDIHGDYFLDYKDIFAGDSVILKQDENILGTAILTNDIHLWVTKPGYYPEFVNATLVKGRLVSRDIVMVKEY